LAVDKEHGEGKKLLAMVKKEEQKIKDKEANMYAQMFK